MKFDTTPTNKATKKEDTSPKKLTKFQLAKIGVIVVVGSLSALEFAGIPTITTIKSAFSSESGPDVDAAYASLSSLSKSTPIATPTINDNIGDTVQSSTPITSSTSTSMKTLSPSSQPIPTKNTENKSVPDFVVAPDYRTVIAAVQMIENAMNSDVEEDWINVRLQVNAEREKNRLAQVKLQRVQAQAKAAEFQKQTADLLNDIKLSTVSKVLGTTDSHGDERYDMELMSIGDDYIDLEVGGKTYLARGVNSQFDGLKVVNIDVERGCATIQVNESNRLRVCI